jgi:hypothetical protein
MNGQRQSKQPTKKEVYKMTKHTAILKLDELEGAALEAMDLFDDDKLPLNTLSELLRGIRANDTMGMSKEWVVNWNKMLSQFYKAAEEHCFDNMLGTLLPITVFSEMIEMVKKNY